MVKTMKAKYPLVSDIHLTNTLIDTMVTFMISQSQMADMETLGEGMSFLLFGVIHAAARSVAQLEERRQEARGSNNTVEEERKYRKAGVALPPMHFHAMEKQIYTYAAWCEMWFGERAEFVGNLWALLTAWRSK